MTLQLVKIEEGLCTGGLLYNESGNFLYSLFFLHEAKDTPFILLGYLEVGR